ncbi:MAG TPA: NHL repeat-containing protein [Chryseolinea sp.]|nr:NHL repeat-containing protein [Chryseolinea sp.]
MKSQMALIAFLAIQILALDARAQSVYSFKMKFAGRPISILSDESGKIYYAHRDDYDIRVHAPTGEFLYKFGTTGTGPQNFEAYDGVTFGPDGHLYIPDAANGRIQVFSTNGVYQRTIAVPNVGSYVGDLAFDAEGNIYINDLFNKEIIVLTSTGSFMRNFSVGAAYARGIDIDNAGQLYISTEYAVNIFTREGSFVKKFCTLESLGGVLSINGTTVFAVDDNRIRYFLSDGTELGSIGVPSSGDYSFNVIWGLFAKGKNIYVSDFEHGFVKVFTGKMFQQVSFDEIAEKTVGDGAFELTAFASSNLPATFTSSDPSIVSIDGATATIHRAGQVQIFASQVGNDDYVEATPVVRQLAVNKKSQTIVLEVIPAKLETDPPFALVANSTSGLPVEFTIEDPIIATISNNVLTILRPGTTTIYGNQSGNETYQAAVQVSMQLLVDIVTHSEAGEITMRTQAVPNPFQQSTTIRIRDAKNKTILFFAPTGAKLHLPVLVAENEILVDFSDLPAGLYAACISERGKHVTVRLLKTK